MTGMINRTFRFMSVMMFLHLYKGLIRPHLDASPVWGPMLLQDMRSIESVQRVATKMITEIRDWVYSQRLIHLNLPTLEFRRLRYNMIQIYKYLNNYSKTSYKILHLATNQHYCTRGHRFKLLKRRFNLRLRSNSFAFRSIDFWNGLPAYVVESEDLISFKANLHVAWNNHSMKYKPTFYA